MLTLDLALATYRPEGIARVAAMDLPVVKGVRYVVSWQEHGDHPVPSQLERDDIKIIRFDLKGQSLNRNNAIDNCTADIILNSDDDLIYDADGLRAVISTFESNPDLDVATFEARMHGAPLYPAATCRLKEPLPKGFWVATFHIAFRRSSTGDLRFHPELGLGSRLMHGSEDELFLLSAIRRKLDCRFFPVTICAHPHESTGTKSKLTPSNLRAMGCYMAIATPSTLPLRLPLKAFRLWRSGRCGLICAARHLIDGARLAPQILKGDRRYLWPI